MPLPVIIPSSKSTLSSALPWGRFALLLMLFLAIACLRTPAQQPATPDDVVRTDTRLAFFPISVRDKSGHAVSGLTEKDLTLKDVDHVTSGLYLYQGADRVSLVFALDQSGSVREVMNQQREAALSLFKEF